MIDSFASKANLKDGPKSAELDKFGGGVDSFASKAPLKDTPTSNKMWEGAGNTIDSFGTKAPLGTKPIKGFEGVEVSDRAKKQYR